MPTITLSNEQIALLQQILGGSAVTNEQPVAQPATPRRGRDLRTNRTPAQQANLKRFREEGVEMAASDTIYTEIPESRISRRAQTRISIPMDRLLTSEEIFEIGTKGAAQIKDVPNTLRPCLERGGVALYFSKAVTDEVTGEITGMSCDNSEKIILTCAEWLDLLKETIVPFKQGKRTLYAQAISYYAGTTIMRSIPVYEDGKPSLDEEGNQVFERKPVPVGATFVMKACTITGRNLEGKKVTREFSQMRAFVPAGIPQHFYEALVAPIMPEDGLIQRVYRTLIANGFDYRDNADADWLRAHINVARMGKSNSTINDAMIRLCSMPVVSTTKEQRIKCFESQEAFRAYRQANAERRAEYRENHQQQLPAAPSSSRQPTTPAAPRNEAVQAASPSGRRNTGKSGKAKPVAPVSPENTAGIDVVGDEPLF